MSNYLFTCYECGNHELLVVHHRVFVNKHIYELVEEWGYLDDGHHWSIEETEVLESADPHDYYENEELRGMGDQPTEDSDRLETWVRCADCDREIEFGWSHSNYGGRIWPVECSDFNPRLAWMDPKYAK